MTTKLLMTVEEMKDRDKWLMVRNLGLGGSDAGIVLGLSKWKSPFQLWLEKTGQVEAEDISDREYVYWGTVLEQAVADRFCELTGKKVRKQGLLQNVEHPWMLASVDRIVIGENAILECKTANGFAEKDWQEDKLPNTYYCQLQHYMAVGGYDKAYIACLIGGNHFVWKEVERNEDDIKALIEIEEKFWTKVLTKTMPDVDGSDSCTEALKEKFSGGNLEAIELDAAASAQIARYFILKEQADSIKTQMDTIRNGLCVSLGDNEYGYSDDHKVSWKVQAGRKSLDTKALEKDHPAIYEKYLKVGKPTRVFRIN